MHLPTLLLGGILAGTAVSAYRIDLYSKWDFQGDQATFTTAYAFPVQDESCQGQSRSMSPALILPLHSGTHKVPWSGGAQSWIWDSLADGCCIAFCRGSTVSPCPLQTKAL